jgi:hypothetical protein
MNDGALTSQAALGFRGAGSILGQDSARCTLGIGRVALASIAPTGPIRPVDLENRDATPLEEASQSSAVRAGTLDPGTSQPAEAASPGEKLLISIGVRLNRERPLHPADGVDDDPDMNVEMRIDTENNFYFAIFLFHGNSFAMKWRRQTMPKDRTLTVQDKAPIRSLAAGSALPR